MSPTFEKIKKHYFIKAIMLALFLGVSSGLLAVGVTMLPLKLIGISLAFYFYIIIGVGVAAVVAAISYLLLRKSDEWIAKRLDGEFNFSERVQTMIEYRNDDGVMAQLQRADTEERLYEIRHLAVRVKNWWISSVALLLSAVVFVVALLIPVVRELPPPPEAPFQITEYQVTALNNLIQFVENGDMSETPKTAIADDLVLLRDELCEVDGEGKIKTLVTKEVMQASVKRSITVADTAVEGYNTYKKLYNSIRTTENEKVKLFAQGVGLTDITDAFEKLRAELVFSESENAEVIAATNALASEIKNSFALVEIPVEDALLTTSVAYCDALTAAVADGTLSYAAIQAKIDGAFSSALQPINDALAQQKVNREDANYVIRELISVFSITDPPQTGGEALAGLGNGSDGEILDTPGGPPDPDAPHYGSDDEIYDPEQETYVEYGDIYYDSNAKKDATVREEETDEELEKIIDDYFSALAGTTVPTPDDQE